MSGHLAAQRSLAKTPGLSAAEEQAARAFASRFILRLNEIRDFRLLLKDFFHPDFIALGRRYFTRQIIEQKITAKQFQDYGVNKKFILHTATNHDLQRLYLAFINVWDAEDRLQTLLWDYQQVQREQKLCGKNENCEKRAAAEVLPPEFFSLGQKNPYLLFIVGLIEGVGIEESDEKELLVKFKKRNLNSRTRLNKLIAQIKQATVWIQRGEDSLRNKFKELAGETKPARQWDRDTGHIYKFDDYTLERATAGLPAGTKIAMARITPYEMLITIDRGQPKMLAVYPDFDGD